MNPDKTEFFLIGDERQRSQYHSMFPIEIVGVKTYLANATRNLGIIFDKNLNFRSHISALCSACFYHMRDLLRVRHYLDLNGEKLLASELVSSRLDYCIADTDQAKLQRVQNRLAHVVTNSPPFTCSVPLRHSLHWLPVNYRVDFKICLLTYKTLSEKQPVYLHSLLATPLPSLLLRSNKGITFPVPRVKINARKMSFSSCAPSLWNSLPLSVPSSTSVFTFRKCLKTYLLTWPFPHRHQHAR